MDVTGARWSLTGAEAVLRLRTLRSSGDFDEYWTFHEAREYERNHRALYAGGIVPPTNASFSTAKRALLKVIKQGNLPNKMRYKPLKTVNNGRPKRATPK
jgi:hypothetical protein